MASKATRRKRSRGYPAFDLRSARAPALLLHDAFGERSFSRDEAAEALGHSSGSSGVLARKLAALVHYSLLERADGNLRITSLALRFLGSDLAEARRARKEAFQGPALFREIEAMYAGEGRLPRYFSQALVEEFGISESAKQQAEAVFRDSARYAEVINEDGEFMSAPVAIQHSPAPRPHAETEPKNAQPSAETNPTEAGDFKNWPIPLDGQGRGAKLVLPQVFYQEDIEALRDYLNFLESRATARPSVLPFKSRS